MAHRLVYHSTLDSRVIKKNKKKDSYLEVQNAGRNSTTNPHVKTKSMVFRPFDLPRQSLCFRGNVKDLVRL